MARNFWSRLYVKGAFFLSCVPSIGVRGSNESAYRLLMLPIEIISRGPFRERGVHVNKPSSNQFLTSELNQRLNYASKEVLKVVQASFTFLWVFLPQNLPILKEITIGKFDVSSRQHQDDKHSRRLLLTSDFQIEISCKIGNFCCVF